MVARSDRRGPDLRREAGRVHRRKRAQAAFSIVFLLAIWLFGRFLKWLTRGGVGMQTERHAFWTRQGISIAVTVVNLIGLMSIWFDDPARLTTAIGLVTAGLAFALQRVVTALAGYVVILRGKTFNVGDRITMGGIRGDVIGLGFLQTVIMEMGQPPEVQNADPAMWVQARQYSGRIVTITNAKVFDDPVYNYTRDFPFIWEEMQPGLLYRRPQTRRGDHPRSCPDPHEEGRRVRRGGD